MAKRKAKKRAKGEALERSVPPQSRPRRKAIRPGLRKRAKAHQSSARRKKAGKVKARIERAKLREGGVYFDQSVARFSSGCELLDCVLGGGWAEGRVLNVVGDKSTGKTLVAIEACSNFHLAHPERPIYYVETEASFDPSYAESIGMPLDVVEFPPEVFTVEDLYELIRAKLGKSKPLWIVDSLDALHVREDLESDLDKGSFGTQKARLMSKTFRDLNQRMGRSGATLMIVSQVRDRIGVTFGKKTTRFGGRALDFYASQVVWLAHLGRIDRTRKGVKRVVGIDVRADLEKSKVSMPFRRCEFPIYFGYGMEDVEAGLEWLCSIQKHRRAGFKSLEDARKLVLRLDRMDSEEYRERRAEINQAVREVWDEVEAEFRPRRQKYARG